MFIIKSKIRKRAACRAEAARSKRLEVEVSEAGVNGVDVVFERDEFERFVVVVLRSAVVVEGGRAKKVVEMFGRDVEQHVVVVARRDSCDESDRQVR